MNAWPECSSVRQIIVAQKFRTVGKGKRDFWLHRRSPLNIRLTTRDNLNMSRPRFLALVMLWVFMIEVSTVPHNSARSLLQANTQYGADHAEFQLKRRLLRVGKSEHPANTLSLLYVIGVEGTGHHGVSPAIASIAKSCDNRVIYESKILRDAQGRLNSGLFRQVIAHYQQKELKGAKRHLMIEDHSFPSGDLIRNSTEKEKKSQGLYNLEWLYDQAAAVGVDIRFLYLTRDFYKTVASHIEFDGTFERHARVLHDFIWYIDAEYQRINAKRPGLWAAVHYEWFRDMENCTALVSAVVDFAGWDRCDVDFACQVLRQTLRNSTKRAVNATDLACARSLNTSISVPPLNISSARSFTFTTVISDRIPFDVARDAASKRRVVLSPGRNATVWSGSRNVSVVAIRRGTVLPAHTANTANTADGGFRPFQLAERKVPVHQHVHKHAGMEGA